jgi:phosphoribosylformimino-5-aminoimidazole carboxamide ribotide isomerase
MLVIPAIDLKEGYCVRLKQGRMDEATIYGDDPLAVAESFADAGARRLHIVDLDAAFLGHPVHTEIIAAICAHLKDRLSVQIGGGIRDLSTIEAYLRIGVDAVILGTAAVRNPAFLKEACHAFAGAIYLGLDTKDGKIAIEGWAKEATTSIESLVQHAVEWGVSAIVATDIKRDGMLAGAAIDEAVALAKIAQIPVIASGGVKDLDDIRALAKHSQIAGVITGRAIYEGTLDLAKAQQLADALDQGAVKL